MREHRVHQLLFGGFEIHGDYVALNQLGHFGADHMRAKERSALFVKNHLDQALVFTKRNRLAVSDERKSPDPNVQLLLFRRLFGKTDRSDLRRAIGTARDEPLVHRVRLQALDRLYAQDALMLGLVCQQRWASHVPDGINPPHAGTIERIDNNRATPCLYANLFEAEILDISGHPDGGDRSLEVERLHPALSVVDGCADSIGFLIELGHLGPGEYLDSLLLELLARECGNLDILNRQNLRQHLNHRYLCAECAIERCELNPDGAGPDDQKRFRQPVGRHRLEIGPHQLLVGFQPGEHARPRTGCDDDVLGFIGTGSERAFGSLAACRPHRDLAGSVDHGLSPNHGNLVLLHEKAYAVVEALRYRARALYDRGRVVTDFLGRKPVILGMTHIVENLRRAQERFGGNAAPIETDAAQILALDDRGLEPQLGGSDSSDVASRPGADDDDVEARVSHRGLSENGG